MTPARPNFRSNDFLRQHADDCMAFYRPRCVDASGGMFHFFRDNGEIYDRHTRHLVSSTRFVFTCAMSHRATGDAVDAGNLKHAFDFLQVHREPTTGGYAWLIDWRDGQKKVLDDTNHAYGLAFVLLAHAHAFMSGLAEAKAGIAETFELLEKHFWVHDHGLYADEANAQWALSTYRGQNANMHLCEALLAAFDATDETRYLDRAETLADNICIRQAALADGLIWEHYHADWSADWNYNKDDKTNIFRPWGFQPGHLTEWAKLLMLLNQRRPRADHVLRARHFFDVAMDRSWDKEHGGLFYGFAPDGSACDTDKYFWVQAETFAAAARLAIATQDPAYWEAYERIWAYSWDHFVDHEHGAWWRILRADNSKISNEKSPAGKVDYHTAGACWDVLDAFGLGLPKRRIET